ncbi:uncharacterized protein LOC132706671 isoform X2 [Cylas formicarius]|uniref:uncharacterized protein LOC132706671 isoform X2 n=1 Tax=Cylas formicarius TaxID=197179 RepID=UPI0029588184|nr:uncharacterized protein LOC132706671 isoform X2 [Cylas formicarius]
MVAIYLYVSLALLGSARTISGEREHKVHNIVLYPEKHSWCQITPIQQVVGSPGYEPVTIENNVCVGACYSYSIPKTEPAEPGELIGPYCDSCQPSEMKCYHVNLHADSTNAEGPKILQKRVQIITNCSCQSCDKIRKEDCEINDANTLELPPHLFTDHESNNKSAPDDFPDLFEAQNAQNSTLKHTENDIKLKNKLKQWFAVYQKDVEENESEKHGHKKHSELLDLEKRLDLNEKNNERILNDLEGLPKSFGDEGVPSHHKGNHVASGIVRNAVDVKKPPEHNHHHGHHQHHQVEEVAHHHYLGEEQQTGHLVRGPHGSMAVDPVEVKFRINSDALKPNNEGLEISYENHRKSARKVEDLMQEE